MPNISLDRRRRASPGPCGNRQRVGLGHVLHRDKRNVGLQIVIHRADEFVGDNGMKCVGGMHAIQRDQSSQKVKRQTPPASRVPVLRFSATAWTSTNVAFRKTTSWIIVLNVAT